MQLLRHQADQRAGGAVVLNDVVAIDRHGALRRLQDAANDADQRGLAGAVGAEQGEDLPAPDVEIDSVESLKSGRVSLREILNGNDR